MGTTSDEGENGELAETLVRRNESSEQRLQNARRQQYYEQRLQNARRQPYFHSYYLLGLHLFMPQEDSN